MKRIITETGHRVTQNNGQQKQTILMQTEIDHMFHVSYVNKEICKETNILIPYI